MGEVSTDLFAAKVDESIPLRHRQEVGDIKSRELPPQRPQSRYSLGHEYPLH